MTWRRVALYYALLAAALLHHWGFERGVVPRPETSSLGVPLVDVPPNRVGEVHLIRAGERVRCREDGGRWSVIEPEGALVPADLISTFVTTLVETRAAELIANNAAEGGGQFGLGPEAVRVELYQRGNDVPVAVVLGGRNPTDTAIYARVEGSPRVLLVGRLLEYYVDRVFEEVKHRSRSGKSRGVDTERLDHTG